MTRNPKRLLTLALAALAPSWSAASCSAPGAFFSAQTGVLTVVGTTGPDALVVGRTEAGEIVVNGGLFPIQGGVPTVSNTQSIVLQGREGDDHLVVDTSGGALPAALILGGSGDDELVGGSGDDRIEGGSGDDVIRGGVGADTLRGGPGNDEVTGGDGDDVVDLGAGDDTFAWNPGDDLDTVEGAEGVDRLLFRGSNTNEKFDLAALDGRVHLVRDVANVMLDLDGIEAIDFAVLGGADVVWVNDLSGTDVFEVNVALAALDGSGDAQPDTVIVSGTEAEDVALVFGDASATVVLGLPVQVTVTGAEAANDRLQLSLLAGDDVLDATGLAATGLQLVAHGGDDHDVLMGGDGHDVLLGGEGDDVLLGGPGIDILDGGAGDNVVIQ